MRLSLPQYKMVDIDKSFKYLNWDDRKYHNIMVLKNLNTADNLLSDTVIDQKAGSNPSQLSLLIEAK